MQGLIKVMLFDTLYVCGLAKYSKPISENMKMFYAYFGQLELEIKYKNVKNI